MGVPTEETRGSITIPGSTGETNFGPTAVTTPAAAPTFVPPSVLAPTPAAPTPPPVHVRELMPTPRVIDRSNTDESPFVRQPPTAGIRSYAPQPAAAPATSPALAVGETELIIMKNGQQFVGQVLDRGKTWRIQLPNGARIAIPANKISGTRPATTGGQ